MHAYTHACLAIQIYICHRMNGLGYHKAFGNDLAGGLFDHFIPLVVLAFFYFLWCVILWYLSVNGSGFTMRFLLVIYGRKSQPAMTMMLYMVGNANLQ